MKRLVSLFLVVVLILGCVGLVACGEKDSGTTQESTQTSPSSSAPSPTQTEPSPTGGLTWNDMPIYSGASQVQKGTWSIPAEQDEWSKVEWRYYESDDSTDDVAAFYKSQMPSEGWYETMWMEAEGVAWAYYTKNDEEDGAMFWVTSDEGETFFALMRSTK